MPALYSSSSYCLASEVCFDQESGGHGNSREEPAKVYNTFPPKEKTPSPLHHTIESVLPDGTSDSTYEAKARVLNSAIQEIGMGVYQWQLFIVIGFGWASDSLWPIVTSLILAPVTKEFNIAQPAFLTLAQNIGLLLGALFWGFGCDIFGRRPGFNLTIGITCLFAMISAASPNFLFLAILVTLWSVGVGGNLPVDSTVFLEFLPGSHQYLLTILSVFWSIAQLLATLIAWPLLSNLSCQPTATSCTRSENFGWRWLLITTSSFAIVMFVSRFFAFHLYESPKYLMGKGRDVEAVEVIHKVAELNGAHSSLTIEALEAISRNPDMPEQVVKFKVILLRTLKKVDFQHVRALFDTPQLALSTSLIITIWALIGLGFPLYNAFIPFIQAERGISFGDGSTALTYRNSLIIAAAGVPGALVGGLSVQMPRVGRKGSLVMSSFLTGASLFGSTTATNSNSLLGWNCAFGLASNFMYAVLYSYTPEIFLTKDRGTGNALTASANRIFGVMAPIVAMTTDLKSSTPVYISGGLFIGAGLFSIALPFEPMGRASL